MPVRHSIRRQSGRSVAGRIAGPYRHCRSTERAVGRTRAGHVHAGRIADGVNSRGAALCASGLAPCGVSWAGTVVPDRQRRAAATPRGHRAERGHPPSAITPTTRTTQSHTVAIGGDPPVQVGGRRASRAGPGRPPFGPTRVGPRMPLPAASPSALPDSPGHWPAHLGTPCSQRHSQATRTPQGPPAPGRPAGTSRDSEARDPGPPAPRHQVATHDIARARSRRPPVRI